MIHQQEDVANRVSQTPPPVSDSDSGTEQNLSAKFCQYIEEKPASSVLIGLGVGLGTGVILGSLLRGSSRYFSPDEAFVERIGNNVKDSLAEIIPSSFKKHFRF
tara:strand:- start:24665 stop:24976 length:312 start_codon:yes stop_codon:yes gene_type:complete